MESIGRQLAVLAAVLIGAGFVASGCGGDSSSDASGASGLSGTVTADGSSTVFPIMQAVAEEYRADNGDVDVSVGESGTGGGMEKFCRGEIDIADASRPIKDEERAACTKAGVAFVELAVALDGLSVVVNPENDFVDCLTMQQLATIWGPKSTVDSWKQVDDSFPDSDLTLYGPGTASGTFEYFTEAVNGEKGASRSDYTASEDDNVLVKGVAGDPGALGYFGYGYVSQNPDSVRAVAVDSGDGCVEPSVETIGDGTYAPLSRPLYVYVATKAAKRAEVAAYVDFLLANVRELSTSVGFVALPTADLEQSKTTWKAVTS